MASRLRIFHYVPADSIAHRLDARFKLLLALAFAISLFIDTLPAHLLVQLGILLIGCIFAKTNPLTLLSSVWIILLVFLLISSLNAVVVQSGTELINLGWLRVTDEGAERALFYGGRLALLLLGGALLLVCTSAVQLTDGLGRLLSPLQRVGVPVSQLAFILALAIRYVPILYDETTSIITAQKCRGARFSHGTLRERSNAIVSLFVPIFVASIRHADNLGQALLSKNYVPGADRTRWSYREFLTRQR